jgi:hypothetical protein
MPPEGDQIVDDTQIRTDLPIAIPVAGHREPVPFYLTADMFGGVPVELAGGEITDLVGKPVADPHRHRVPEVYFLISPHPGGARISVTVGASRYQLASPALLHVPAGAEHCFVTEQAEPGSYCFGILLGRESR